ncbi:nicotinate (nicotinamide) nucleotide adenylyltransferase [uncultured Subdoligranulum sp.]|uniref:nicotinate (nicotinamide) nucleotide adenylyltransferase n=1 Tax=uncultured Subdoligranulum sp. TaxID=512298 RepID=UPI0025CDC230|nr:nicotinate (nicotinamide) nucleotide adenylyltransferase [uncultured Subdoligranulum sp.]
MKVLLFGGTFDPPHNGHMNNLRAALDLVQPDKAIVMPAGIPPHKAASATPGEVRLAMCRCFTALSPVVEVSDWEIRQGGRSYTVHTLEMLRDRFPEAELYLGVGSDMLLSFTRWRRWQEILSMATLVVESRRPGDGTALHTGAEALQAAGGRVLFAHAQSYPCASSDLRTGRIPRADWGQYLPATVLQVIQSQDLYRTADVPPVEKEEPNHDL